MAIYYCEGIKLGTAENNHIKRNVTFDQAINTKSNF